MNLHELTNEFKELQDFGLDTDSQVYIDTLEAIKQPIIEKGVNIVKLTDSWQGTVDTIDSEIKRLQARKNVFKNKIDSLKEWLRFNMEYSGIDKIECPLFTITLRQPSKNSVLVIDDENELLKHYEKVVKPSIDTVRLKADLKSGQSVLGAHLEDSKCGLMIK